MRPAAQAIDDFAVNHVTIAHQPVPRIPQGDDAPVLCCGGRWSWVDGAGAQFDTEPQQQEFSNARARHAHPHV